MIKIIDLHFQGLPQTIAAFLVETTEGAALIETGPHSTLPALEKALRAEGYELADVGHVFLTHIHLDHGGAAWFFAKNGATIYLHPLGERHLENPEKLLASARQIYKDEMDRLWGDLQPIEKERLRVVGHEEEIRVGETVFKALHTPGHAVHHIAWQIDRVLFTGDVAGIKIDGGIVVPPCPPPDIHLPDWQASIQLIKSKGFDALYLTHFGLATDVENHLSELETRLLDWANWMKPYFENNANPAEVTPLFQAYVASQLEAAGIQGEDLEKYESANPAWMSVVGLLRYWRKATQA